MCQLAHKVELFHVSSIHPHIEICQKIALVLTDQRFLLRGL